MSGGQCALYPRGNRQHVQELETWVIERASRYIRVYN